MSYHDQAIERIAQLDDEAAKALYGELFHRMPRYGYQLETEEFYLVHAIANRFGRFVLSPFQVADMCEGMQVWGNGHFLASSANWWNS